MNAVFAVIPIKRFEYGKTRLAERLDAAARSELTRRMFEHVLNVCLGCEGLAGVLVVTDAAEIAEQARERGARALLDPPIGEGPRLSEVIDAALAHLREAHAHAAVVLMADLPLLQPADLEHLLAGLEQHDLVLAPDARGQHTNALGLRLGASQQFRSAFGSAQSLDLHQARARALGFTLRVEPNPRLALDIDLAADLDALARSREDE